MGSYETMAQMRMDPLLNSRISSCIIQQAQGKPDSPFVETIKNNIMSMSSMFVTLMTTDDLMTAAYETKDGVPDEMILSGVQTHWDEVESMWRRSVQKVPAPIMLP